MGNGGSVHVIGVDLSGPGNVADTAIAVFEAGERALKLRATETAVGDLRLFERVEVLAARGPVVAGLDAPLSYQPGGGDRPGDKALRRAIVSAGMHSGSVMTPTMTRMAYLTLRGVAVSRTLGATRRRALRIVEVHPGAAMALRGAPIADVRAFKRDAAARDRLLAWLDARGLHGVKRLEDAPDHLVAACACALAAWRWSVGDSAWLERAAPPAHPYDFSA